MNRKMNPKFNKVEHDLLGVGISLILTYAVLFGMQNILNAVKAL